MGYFMCAAGAQMFDEANAAAPKRSKISDGWIGDASHQAAKSDHNPCWTCTGKSYGVVRAIDITHDPRGGFDSYKFAEWLRRFCKANKDHGRVWYIISNGRIASNTYGWEWRPYSGSNPHDHHVHISFYPAGDLDGRPFGYASGKTQEENEVQLNDDLYPGDDQKDVTVGQVLRQLDNFMSNTNKKLRAIDNKVVATRAKVAAAKKAVDAMPEGATKAEVRALLEGLDVELSLIVPVESTEESV